MIIVEMIQVEDQPNSIGFTFEMMDGINPTAQQLIDALADFLLINAPDDMFKKRKELMQ
jgi:hypothetical protein